jgi:hypothetical protein
MKPKFNLVTVDHHLNRRHLNKDVRDAKAYWVSAMGYFINFRKEHRTVILN